MGQLTMLGGDQKNARPCICLRLLSLPFRHPLIAHRPALAGSEIKHDGFRMKVRRDGAGIRLLTRRGHDWTDRFPLIAEAVRLRPARAICPISIFCRAMKAFERHRKPIVSQNYCTGQIAKTRKQ